MSYQPEHDDDFRQSLRYGGASQVLRFWPKVRGLGNVATTGTPTYAIRRPGDSPDVAALASGNATVTAEDSVHMLSASVDLSSTTTWLLGSYYQCLFSWSHASGAWLSSIYFDVVRDPWLPDISLNDFAEEVADAEARMTSQADRIETGRTAADHAAVVGVKAWGDVLQWLRQKSEPDGVDLLPHLVADREVLRRVTTAQAISRMYALEGGGQGSEDAAQADRWARTARQRFESMGPLRYTLGGESRAASAATTGFGVVRVGRSWGGGS